MRIAIIEKNVALPVLSPEQLEEPLIHIECGNELRRLEDGRVQCLTCMKVGWPGQG